MGIPLTIGKPRTLKKMVVEEIRHAIAVTVAKRSSQMIEAQMDVAIGITSERHDAKTGELYYVEQGPNVAAARLLLEYTVGKPIEKKDVRVAVGIVDLVNQLSSDNGDSNEEDN